jgi:hypothetical protein
MPPCEVLDEAHHETVLFRRFEHDGWDLGLSERYERLQATLAAHEVVP